MRISRWRKVIGFLALVAGINAACSFFIEPVNGASERMWAGYYAEEEIDMIFIGSSLSQQTFIPDIFNENMGVKSYNMGTPAQAMLQSLRAVEAAIKEHDIKTVIYGMGFSSLKYEPIPEAEYTFESARIRQKGGFEGAMDMLSYIYSEDMCNTEESINILFPWLYNYENYEWETLRKNASQKLENLKEVIQNGERDKTDGLAKGYRNDDTTVFDYHKKWEVNTNKGDTSCFSEEMMAEFEQMLKLCKEKGIDLIVLNTPHPAFDVITCYEYYEQNQEELKAYCEKYGADYYDFSLAKPEIYEIKENYFCDYEHLNRQGSEDFCRKLSEFLNRRAEGEDMEQYFYSIEEFFELHAEELAEWKAWKEKQEEMR